MGHRFIASCECESPLYQIADKAQGLRCYECEGPLVYEVWGQTAKYHEDFGVSSAPKDRPRPLAVGWTKEDDVLLNEWFDSPEY